MKKHIVCFGDSNTHGYCADPADCADGGSRFNEDERWTCLLQKKLGDNYLVIEEGLNGRTTVFVDPLHESMDAVSVVSPILMSHEPVDLLIIMLGTNDTKERFNANAVVIAAGMERLIQKCCQTYCWKNQTPNILVVCPPPMREGFHEAGMGEGCRLKSLELHAYLESAAKRCGAHYLNAAACEFNEVDYMHLTRKGHSQLADLLAGEIPALLA